MKNSRKLTEFHEIEPRLCHSLQIDLKINLMKISKLLYLKSISLLSGMFFIADIILTELCRYCLEINDFSSERYWWVKQNEEKKVKKRSWIVTYAILWREFYITRNLNLCWSQKYNSLISKYNIFYTIIELYLINP